ncbi:MAG: fatty acid desaturase, partial [Caldisericaceae bacterium]|nr:fatty acid desaturase [Caldisericaceae bacterium]
VLPLTILSGLMMVRTFIIFHDTCHGSFFKSKTLNKWIGRLTGLLTFTPFEEWRQAHNYHHASSGDLDRRGTEDVWTMTVEEYQKAS